MAPNSPSDRPTEGTRSQTLHRGLVLLELVAEAGTPVTVNELASRSGLHRSIVYRLLRTLEDHRLLARSNDDRFSPGLGLLGLSRGLTVDLRAAAAPELTALADDTGMTAFVVVRDGDEALTLASTEPTNSPAAVSYRPGHRHPVTRGAPGLGLLMADPAVEGERPELAPARARGWIRTAGEVLSGLSAICAPIPGPQDPRCAVAVVFAGECDEPAVGTRVRQAARRIADRLS